MKHTMKRGLSLVLALCMVLGLVVLPGAMEAQADNAESTCATEVYTHAMDTFDVSTYRVPTGWTRRVGYFGQSDIKTAGNRTYYELRNGNAADTVDVNYAFAENQLGTKMSLKYDFMVDNEREDIPEGTWLVQLPTFTTSSNGRVVNLMVRDYEMNIGNGTSFKTLEIGRWYEIEIVLDTSTGAAAVYVDQEQAYSYTVTSGQVISKLAMGVQGGSSFVANYVGFAIDNLSVVNHIPAVYTQAMDTYEVSTYRVPTGWTRRVGYFGQSDIKTAGNRTYYELRNGNAADTVDVNYAFAESQLGSKMSLKYDFMVDNEREDIPEGTWLVQLPTFTTSSNGRVVNLMVRDYEMNIGNGDSFKTLEIGRWYEIEIVLDTSTGAAAVYVDQEQAHSYTVTSGQVISKLAMGVQGGAGFAANYVGFAIDDLAIYDHTACTSVTGSFAAASYNVNVGNTVATALTLQPANATVKYHSSNTAVATVDDKGVVTGVAPGTAVITVSAQGCTIPSIASTWVVVSEEQPELKFSYAVPVLANDLAIEFQAKGELFGEGKYTNPTASFTFNGKIVTADLTYNSENDRYVCLFTGIAPHQMGDEITYTLSATYDGETVTSVAKTYSMLQYCTKELENSPSAKLEALLVSTLNYGAAAQVYSGYKTTSLVNAGLTPEQQTVTAPELGKVTSTGENNKEQQAVWKTATVILDNAIVTEFKFQSTLSNLTVKINGSTDYVTVVAGENNMYTVYYEGLNAAQLSNSIEAVVYSDGEAVSSTLTYSVESCAYYHVNENANASDALKALVNAMMAYGDAAYAFGN